MTNNFIRFYSVETLISQTRDFCTIRLSNNETRSYLVPLLQAAESTPLNKLAVADAGWGRMPVDGLNMTLA